MLLVPKKVKHRKWFKGRSRNRQIDTRGTTLSYGSYGIQALGSAWLTSRQIEAARKVITRYVRKQGRLWIRVFPDKPVTKRPPEVTMGGGKGAVDHYVFPVRPGRIIFEIDGLDKATSRRVLTHAGHKLPFKVRVIEKD